jgi:hypothetical protein
MISTFIGKQHLNLRVVSLWTAFQTLPVSIYFPLNILPHVRIFHVSSRDIPAWHEQREVAIGELCGSVFPFCMQFFYYRTMCECLLYHTPIPFLEFRK